MMRADSVARSSSAGARLRPTSSQPMPHERRQHLHPLAAQSVTRHRDDNNRRRHENHSRNNRAYRQPSQPAHAVARRATSTSRAPKPTRAPPITTMLQQSGICGDGIGFPTKLAVSGANAKPDDERRTPSDVATPRVDTRREDPADAATRQLRSISRAAARPIRAPPDCGGCGREIHHVPALTFATKATARMQARRASPR
jgi:hypothetical protein